MCSSWNWNFYLGLQLLRNVTHTIFPPFGIKYREVILRWFPSFCEVIYKYIYEFFPYYVTPPKKNLND